MIKSRAALVWIALIVIALYSFMLHAPFRGMDDGPTIVDNPVIRDVRNVPQVLTGSFFQDRSYYRPLVTLSFMAEYHVFGLNAFWYNLDNVLLHIVNSLCVFILMLRLWNDRTTALWVCLLFAIHPVQWEAVSNVSGRSILLNTLFIVTAFILFIDFCKRGRMIFLLGSVVSFILALLCKESAAIFPVVILLYLFFFPNEGKRPWFAVVPFFLFLFGFILLRHQLGITQLFGWGSWDASLLGFLTFARGVITYLRLFFFPVDLYFDRSRMVFQDFSDPEISLTVFFWLAVFFGLWQYRRRVDARVMFLVFWFLMELAPVSQIVTSLGVQPGFISLAEHFLYMPSIAMLTLLVITGKHLWDLNRTKKIIAPQIAGLAVGGFVCFLSLTTIQQTVYASNELAMLRRSVLMQPFNSRVHYSLGMIYVHQGKFQAAEQYFRHATSIDPWNVRARISLGKSLCDQGRYEEGIAVYRSIHDAGSFEAILNKNLSLSLKILDSQRK